MSVVSIGTDGIVVTPDPTPTAEAAPKERADALPLSRTTVALLFGALAAGLRLFAVRTSIDVFIEGVTYTRVASNIAHGHGVTLDGQAFQLPPPAGLALYALAILGLGLHGTTD